ncbi:TlpA family protein disulfide reductase [Mucilaginibacter sp. NFX135]|uniref:TlpA family protein disulfide reductase n=1 Tax=Mucilaginibacter sp. NFX135 TaxID=3402687 RepID=UPI003AFB1EAB
MADPVNIAFIDSSGNVLNTNSLKGKVIFVNLWATWCPPCIAEMPNLNAFYKRYKNYPNAVFILADVDNNYTKAKAFMKKHQYILPVYTLAGNIPENIMDGTIPTTLIFNKKGELVFKHTNAANFRELADAERIGMLVQKTVIEESKKAYNANKPMPQYQIHAFYLVHEKLF